MSAIRSWKLVVAGIAAAVVIAGGVGMTMLQLRAGDANEPGPPNIDTRSWITERSAQGYLIRRPADWTSHAFTYSLGHAGFGGGGIISNQVYDFGGPNEPPVFRRLPQTLAAVRITRSSAPPPLDATPPTEPNTRFPLDIQHGTPDGGPSNAGGTMLRFSLVVDGKRTGGVDVWVGDRTSRRDAEIARRVVASFGFEAPVRTCLNPGCPARTMTVAEKNKAEQIALADKRVAAKVSGKFSRVVGFGFSPGPGDRVPRPGPCSKLAECIAVRVVNYTDGSWFTVRVKGAAVVKVIDELGNGPVLSLEEQMIAHEIAESYRGTRTALKGRPHTHPFFAHDQGGPSPCDRHRCAFVFFEIARGLKFSVSVDLNDNEVVAFRGKE